MNILEIGLVYSKGKLTREITKIDGGNIYYKNQHGKLGNCWITTFQDWVNEGKKNKCDWCSSFRDYKDFKRGEGCEEIFYDSKNDKHILALEQFRYEYATLEIKYCPICGRKLK